MKLFKDSIDIEFASSLFYPDSISEKKLSKIKDKIRKGKGSYKLILLSEKEDENFEIVSVSNLKSRIWEEKIPVAIGIAGDEDKAFELVAEIAKECQKARGDLSLKEYVCSL